MPVLRPPGPVFPPRVRSGGISRGLVQSLRWWLDLAPIAVGGLLVATAYALGRAHSPLGELFYWLGEATMMLPSIWRVLSPEAGTASRLRVLVGVAAMQSVLTWAYSPDQFRFPDELQHLRTAQDILTSHRLFTPNLYLPVSPGFPGLEEVTTAIRSLTGLRLFASGVIVASLSHVLLPVALFLAYREIAAGDERSAAVATLVYSMAPHYSYFETLFIYSTPALTYLAFTLAAAARALRRGRGLVWIPLAYVPMLLSHHLTTLVGLGLLLVMAAIALRTRPRVLAVRFAGAVLAIVLASVSYIALAAPSTWSYLAAPLQSALGGLFSHSGGGGAHPAAAAVAPAWESLAALASALLLLVLSYVGVAATWWARARRWVQLFALLGLAYPVILGVRLTAADGPELATRGLTYAMLVIAFPAAILLVSLTPLRLGGRRLGFGVAFLAVALLALGAIVEGLPPAYERLPGHFYVASFESGVDARVTAVGGWAARTWTANDQRVACDVSVCSEWSGRAGAVASTTASPLFYTASVARLNAVVKALALDWVETDQRWTTQVPRTGSYFPNDSRANAHTHPLPLSWLTKFDRDPLIDRVYDDGDIHVYRVSSVWNG
ncbi:MAG TPA: hypothetical protein VFN48_07170 [Solirubrobacteraceae bacterium]|nr:hypothetical protein [Solirubrobacteraceae bacterium]